MNNKSVLVRGKNEVNTRAIVGVHSTSASWQDFRLLCCIMDLPIPSEAIHRAKVHKFVETTNTVVARSMKLSADNVYLQSSSLPSIIPGAINCTVSFDASWHRRGHYSNQGFAAVIDSEFGKVLDYVLYDRVCIKCSQWPNERKEKEPDEYNEYWIQHKDSCTLNYKDTSQSMESSAAVEIWHRSIEKNQLVYDTYIGDGDSSSFKNLLKSNPYKSLFTVRKEECLGHVQKRLKKWLKKKKPSSRGLSEAKADRIAHPYALVIFQNRGRSPDEIRDALQTLVSHIDEKHHSCLVGGGSWCYFQKKIATTPDSDVITRERYLTSSEFQRLVETFHIFAALKFLRVSHTWQNTECQ